MAYELCSSCVLPWTMFRLMAYEFALSLNEEELKTIKARNLRREKALNLERLMCASLDYVQVDGL